MAHDSQAQEPLLEQGISSHIVNCRSATCDSRGASLAQRPRSLHSLHFWSWVAQLLLFAASVAILLQSWIPSNGTCVEKLSPYSPALEAIGDGYRWQEFKGTVKKPSPEFTGHPTNETMANWHKMISEPAFSIDHDTLVKIGAPESSIKLPEALGGGYVASLEVYHQIHCVQELWKNTWPDFYSADAGTENSTFRLHLDHCADLLRQKLFCDGDLTLLTYNWVKHLSHPTPNFNTRHKCRKMEDVSAWAKQRQIILPESGNILKPTDDFGLHKPADAIELEDFP